MEAGGSCPARSRGICLPGTPHAGPCPYLPRGRRSPSSLPSFHLLLGSHLLPGGQEPAVKALYHTGYRQGQGRAQLRHPQQGITRLPGGTPRFRLGLTQEKLGASQDQARWKCGGWLELRAAGGRPVCAPVCISLLLWGWVHYSHSSQSDQVFRHLQVCPRGKCKLSAEPGAFQILWEAARNFSWHLARQLEPDMQPWSSNSQRHLGWGTCTSLPGEQLGFKAQHVEEMNRAAESPEDG